MPGVADLPLHTGRVPPWMLRLMERMGEKIVEAVIEIHGVEGLLRGLSDPIWFQAFNNVIGMDWDSSGSTTVLTGILKTVSWRRRDLGFLVLGGKGRSMTRIPEEAVEASRILDVGPEDLASAGKLTARIASSLLQDGYTIYHHALIATSNTILVISQGMNTGAGMARRYHIDKLVVEEPFSGISGVRHESVLNVASRDSREARRTFIDIIGEGSRRIIKLLYEANRIASGSKTLLDYISGGGSEAPKRRYKPVIPSRSLIKAIEELANAQPSTEEELALAPGLGPTVVRALALIADLIYSTPTDTRDPVTHPLDPFLYAYAVGGKDGIPYKYRPDTARKAIEVLEEAIEASRLGDREKLRALGRLRSLVRGTPRARY